MGHLINYVDFVTTMMIFIFILLPTGEALYFIQYYFDWNRYLYKKKLIRNTQKLAPISNTNVSKYYDALIK